MERLIRTTTILGLSCALLPAFAQGPSFGLKGGLNYSTLAANEADDENARLGPNLGLFVRTMPEKLVGVQAELLYSAKGSRTRYSTFFGLIEQDVDFNLNYLELPVLASLRAGGVLDLHLGAYAAYLLSARVKTSGDLGSSSDELDRSGFRSLDYGLAGGAGLNLGTNWQVGLRYTHGLADVADSQGSRLVLGSARNRVAQLYLAFGIGKE